MTTVTVHDQDDRKVYLTIRDMEAFRSPEGAGSNWKEELKGEKLVTALLEANKGNVSSVERYKGGKRNDGPNGEEHSQHFNLAGTKIQSTRYTNDKQNDGPKGEPAFQSFSDEGKLIDAESYKDNISRGKVHYDEMALAAHRATANVLAQAGHVNVDVSLLAAQRKSGPKQP